MRELTHIQLRVLNFVLAFQHENQLPPTRQEIAEHFGWKSANAAQCHLNAIAAKGHIVLSPGRSRGIFSLRTNAHPAA